MKEIFNRRNDSSFRVKVFFSIKREDNVTDKDLWQAFRNARLESTKLQGAIDDYFYTLKKGSDGMSDPEYLLLVEMSVVAGELKKHNHEEGAVTATTNKMRSMIERLEGSFNKDSASCSDKTHELYRQLKKVIEEVLQEPQVVLPEAALQEKNVHAQHNAAASQLRFAKAAQQVLYKSLGIGLTVTGGLVLLSTLGALSPSMSTLIAANPIAGGCVLAVILLVGAALTAVGSIHVHAAKAGQSVKELFAGSNKEEQQEAGKAPEV